MQIRFLRPPWDPRALFLAALSPLSFAFQQEPPAPAGRDEPEARERKVFESPESELKVAVENRTFGYHDPTMSVQSMTFDPKGRSLAYIVMTGGGLAVVHNGEQGEVFDGLAAESLAFSPDGSHLAYAAHREGRNCVVLDGEVYEHDGVGASGIAFSPDGSRVAWVAEEEGKQFAVIDGERKKRYDGIAPRGVVFSEDGERYAYVASQDGEQTVVLDGEEVRFHERVLHFWFSPKGRLAYASRDGDERVLYFDGERVGTAQAIGRDGFVFPREGGRYAIAVARAEGWFVLVDGEEHGPYRSVMTLAFSPDGSHFGYVGGRGKGMFLVLDGQEQTGFKRYVGLNYSPDGERVAWIGRNEDVEHVVLDGEQGPAFDRISPPRAIFSKDGERSAYRGRRGDAWHVVLDGELSPPFPEPGPEAMRFVSGSRLLYSVLREEGQALAVDLVEGRPYAEIAGPVFAEDGSRFAYFGQRDGLWYLVDDGEEVEGAVFTRVFGTPAISSDGERLAYAGFRDGKAFVTVDGVEGRRLDFVMPGTLTFSPGGEHLVYVGAEADRRYIVVDDLLLDGGWEGFLRGDRLRFDEPDRFSIRATSRGKLMVVECEIL